MSDEQDRPRDVTPSDDDATVVGGSHPDGDPRSGDIGGTPADQTRQMPRIPAGDGATAVPPTPAPPRDATSVLPQGADAWNAPSGAGPAWSGRASVRAPQPGQEEYVTTTDWTEPGPREPQGRWWMPILIGIVALLLLALLGWGIWLIVRAGDDDSAPAPVVSTAAATPTTTEATTPERTTEPATPTTEVTTRAAEPTKADEPDEPEEVTVPALRGLSQREAQDALDRRGLSYRLIYRSSEAAPGTVIDSDPAEGQEIPADTQVTLVIAGQRAAPRTTPPTSGSPQSAED